MFTLNDDLSIYATRGDTVFFTVTAEENGVPYFFEAGDVLRMKIFQKKNATKVVLEKDFPVTARTDRFIILLTEEDTKFGDVISKPTDYWYEIELNPYTNPQTIIGYDEDGAKVFRLFPEGKDSEDPEVDPEDIPVVDDELDMTSPRPVRNRAIAKAVVNLEAAYQVTKEEVTQWENDTSEKVASLDSEISVERARIDNFVKGATVDDAELIDIRVGADGATYGSAGTAVRAQIGGLNEVVGFSGIHEYSVSNSSTKDIKNIKTSKQYMFYVPESPNLVSITFYVFDKSGNYENIVTIAPGSTAMVKTKTDTDFIRIYHNVSGACNFKLLMYEVNEYALEPRVRELERHPVAWNNIVGASTGRISIDSKSMMFTISGILMFENGTYHDFEDGVSILLTDYVLNQHGETVRLILDADYNIKIQKVSEAYKSGDIFVCLIYAWSGWEIAADRIYTNSATRKIAYFNGKVLEADTSEELTALHEAINSLRNVTAQKTCKIFKRVCCCGDSYTSGHIVYKDGTSVQTNEEFAWPHYMSTLTGNEWVNCGRSGANVLTWQTWDRGLSKAKETGKVQAYVIGLMINDTAVGTDRYVSVGTIDDIGTDTETYYGGMSKIIRELNAISPEAKIFVQTCPREEDKFIPYNQAVRDIVAAYKGIYPVHCLDLHANIELYKSESLTKDSIGGHYTAIGYSQFAEILALIMSNYINENIKDFQDVHLIEYDE